ncbi:MAG: hypothetical protein ACLPSL_14255 [Smithella sp.]
MPRRRAIIAPVVAPRWLPPVIATDEEPLIQIIQNHKRLKVCRTNVLCVLQQFKESEIMCCII